MLRYACCHKLKCCQGGTFRYPVKLRDNFCEHICVFPRKNNQMVRCDRQRGLGEISSRQKRINLTRKERKDDQPLGNKCIQREEKLGLIHS